MISPDDLDMGYFSEKIDVRSTLKTSSRKTPTLIFLLGGKRNCCIKEGCSASTEWRNSIMARDFLNVVVDTFGRTPAAFF